MSLFRRNIMMWNRPVESTVSIPVPTISPSAGTISLLQAISISISGDATSAEYSFDGETWVTYTAPFTLLNDATVYARATDGNGNYSSVVNNSYIVIPYDAQVEYLESDGNQWINTGFAPSQDDLRIIVDAFQVTSANSIIYGMTDVSSTLKLNNVWYNGSYLYFRYRSYNTRFGIRSGERHTIETGPSMKIDGNVKATPSFTSSFVGNTNIITLFGQANAATPTGIGSAFKGRIYEFSIYYGSTLQMHLIPVRLNSIGYMYDTVSKEMFSNNGSGNFSYGNDVV